MAHERKRYIIDNFNKLLKFSPVIGIFGHRQTGKSTFLAANVKEYRTLDDINQLELASANPKNYINDRHKTPMAIDECQYNQKTMNLYKKYFSNYLQQENFINNQ